MWVIRCVAPPTYFIIIMLHNVKTTLAPTKVVEAWANGSRHELANHLDRVHDLAAYFSMPDLEGEDKDALYQVRELAKQLRKEEDYE